MNSFTHLTALSLVLAVSAAAPAYAAPDEVLESIRGTLQNITVGGVETPRRPAIQIGARRFEPIGASRLVGRLRSLDGFEVVVTGEVSHKVNIGGEGCPILAI